MNSGYVKNLLGNLTDDFKKQWSITETGYFTPKRIYYNGSYEYVVTKQFIVNILFPKFSSKRQQKILQKAKKLNVWSKNNNVFTPITQRHITCRRGCKHLLLNYLSIDGNYWYQCYDNQVEYTREYLKLKLNNIPDDDKIKNTNDNYSVNLKIIVSLTDIFTILMCASSNDVNFMGKHKYAKNAIIIQ